MDIVNRRNSRPAMGRRYAKSPLELMAEIPHHLRRRSTTQGTTSHAPSNTNNIKNKQKLQLSRTRSDLLKPRLIRSTNNCMSSIGGSHVSNYNCAHDVHKLERMVHRKPNPRTTLQKPLLVRSTHSPMHRRQHAMVWDDLVSILRIEVMEDTPTTLQSCTDGDNSLGVSHAIELVLDNPPATNNTNSIELVLVNADDNKIPTPYVDNNLEQPLTPVRSPPKTRRLSMCFDSNMNNNRGLSAIGRMVRRLSPMARRLSPPVVMRRRMSFKFGGRGSNPSAGSVAQYSRSDTYISDSEDDSSLDYSDDDEDVEAAILASAAVFSQYTKLEEDREEEEFVECAICLGGCTDSSNIATINGCNHSFCFKCIDEWATKKNECPLCKEEFHLVTSNSRVRWY